MSVTAVRDGSPQAAPPRVRIVLVDDHAILRDGLRSVLERESDLTIETGAPRVTPARSPSSR